MTRKEVYESLTEVEKELFVIGAMIYDDNTYKGKKALTMEQAVELSDTSLQALLYFLLIDDSIDLNINSCALKTIEVCVSILNNRTPTEYNPDVKAKWEDFKRNYFTEV